MPKKESDNLLEGIFLTIVGIGLLLYFLWICVVQPTIIWVQNWIQQNMLWISVGLIVFIAIASLYSYYDYREKEKRKAEKEAFYKSQKEKGLELFVDRYGNERWGTPREIAIWKKEDEVARQKEISFYKVVDSIKKFQPSRRYKNEFPLSLIHI